MGLQDRDYWKERYDERMGVKRHQQPQRRGKGSEKLERMKFFKDPTDSSDSLPHEVDSRQKPEEYSFMGKFVMGLIVLFCAVLAYRYLK